MLLARRAVRGSITASPALPVTTAEVKTHLGISASTWDAQLDAFTAAARDYVENWTGGYAVMTAPYTMTFETWPVCIELPVRPVSSVSSVKYYDADSVQQTWTSTNYRLDAGGAMPRIVYDDTAVLPALDIRPEAVEVIFVAGTVAAAVPTPVKQAVLLLVGHWYENRGTADRGMGEVPHAVTALLTPYMRSSYP